jgi:hypothetical protein
MWSTKQMRKIASTGSIVWLSQLLLIGFIFLAPGAARATDLF